MLSGEPDDATTVNTKEDQPPYPKHKPYPEISKEPIYGPPDTPGPGDQVDADDL